MTSGSTEHAINELISNFFALFDNRQHTPDFQRLYDFFIEGAIITKYTQGVYERMDLPRFIAPREELLSQGSLTGFHEWEVSYQNFIQPGIATRLSWYAKEGVFQGQPFQGQGRKSFQLLFTENTWKIVSVLWEDD